MHPMSLRLPDEQKERWEQEADERGVSLSDLIRDAVEESILRRKRRKPKVHAPSIQDQAVGRGQQLKDMS